MSDNCFVVSEKNKRERN